MGPPRFWMDSFVGLDFCSVPLPAEGCSRLYCHSFIGYYRLLVVKSSILHLLVVVVALSVLHHLRRSVTQRAEELILGAPVGDRTPRLVAFVVLIN